MSQRVFSAFRGRTCDLARTMILVLRSKSSAHFVSDFFFGLMLDSEKVFL